VTAVTLDAQARMPTLMTLFGPSSCLFGHCSGSCSTPRDDPADELTRRWGYDLTTEWRESGGPGYRLAGVRHIRGGAHE
jgi:hypothetical protein